MHSNKTTQLVIQVNKYVINRYSILFCSISIKWIIIGCFRFKIKQNTMSEISLISINILVHLKKKNKIIFIFQSISSKTKLSHIFVLFRYLLWESRSYLHIRSYDGILTFWRAKKFRAIFLHILKYSYLFPITTLTTPFNVTSINFSDIGTFQIIVINIINIIINLKLYI